MNNTLHWLSSVHGERGWEVTFPQRFFSCHTARPFTIAPKYLKNLCRTDCSLWNIIFPLFAHTTRARALAFSPILSHLCVYTHAHKILLPDPSQWNISPTLALLSIFLPVIVCLCSLTLTLVADRNRSSSLLPINRLCSETTVNTTIPPTAPLLLCWCLTA